MDSLIDKQEKMNTFILLQQGANGARKEQKTDTRDNTDTFYKQLAIVVTIFFGAISILGLIFR